MNNNDDDSTNPTSPTPDPLTRLQHSVEKRRKDSSTARVVKMLERLYQDGNNGYADDVLLMHGHMLSELDEVLEHMVNDCSGHYVNNVPMAVIAAQMAALLVCEDLDRREETIKRNMDGERDVTVPNVVEEMWAKGYIDAEQMSSE